MWPEKISHSETWAGRVISQRFGLNQAFEPRDDGGSPEGPSSRSKLPEPALKMLFPPPESFRHFADRDLIAGQHGWPGFAWEGGAVRLSVHANRQFATHLGRKMSAARREPAREESRQVHRIPPARIADRLWPVAG